ncbi:MAG: hypothetical protein CMB73_07760 [Euryarchaeota archaeon]|jgi:THO complex subunit 2|nr:hypothetical protein [Euryarchaeota archaeon]|tara:strand:+ start:2099 stop:5008 length:2910 start_codon:yes stop_codon:yes gene_type:complete
MNGAIISDPWTVDPSWCRKQLRINTKRLYQLQRFNIAGEQLEGFSKLFCLAEKVLGSFEQFSKGIEIGRSISGLYELDATRFVDFLFALTLLEHALNRNSCFELIWKHSSSSSAIIGFRVLRFLCSSKRAELEKLIDNVVVKGSGALEELYWYLFVNESSFHANVTLSKVGRNVLADDSDTIGFKLFLNSSKGESWHSFQAALERFAKLGGSIFDVPKLRKDLCRQLKLVVCEHFHLDRSQNTIKVKSDILQLAFILGPYVCSDASLLAGLLTCLRDIVFQCPKELEVIESVVSSCIIPGLAFLKPNPAICELTWELLKELPVSIRSKIYKYASSTPRLAQLGEIQKVAQKSVQRLLRRLSNENTKLHGRKLSKLTLCHPCIVTSTVMQQIEAYPNMIDTVVDALKYCDKLTHDVLMCSLLARFSGTKSKLKEDGQNLAHWFSALCSFCGALNKRYDQAELSAVLYYIYESSRDGCVLPLFIMKDLVSKMTSIDAVQDISTTEIERLAGGEELNKANPFSPYRKKITKSMLRLRNALKDVKYMEDLTIPLLMTMLNCRSNIIFETSNSQLKFLSQLHDECHAILLQYVAFLQTAYSPSDYEKLLPPLCSLLEQKIEPALAFHIYRPLLQRTFAEAFMCRQNEGNSRDAVDSWYELTSVIENCSSPDLWAAISPELYLTFWTFDVGDVYVPTQMYRKSCLPNVEIYACSEQKLTAKFQSARARGNEMVGNQLSEELANRVSNAARHKEYITLNASKWIRTENTSTAAAAILCNCVLPRCKVSHVDALYSSKFMFSFGSANIPTFSTLQYFDHMFCLTSHHTYACSQFESKFFATFLESTLQQLVRLRKIEVYGADSPDVLEIRNYLRQADIETSFNDFLKIVFKWEHRLTKGILHNLKKYDYMQVSNSLYLLITIVETFPFTGYLGEIIYRQVKRINLTDKRGDIMTISSRYLSLLDARRSKWTNAPSHV